MMTAVDGAKGEVGAAAACQAVGLPRATYYRVADERANPSQPSPRPTPNRALTPLEREGVLEVARSDRFADVAPAQIFNQLLDEGRYLCSISTIYRILHAAQEVRERRNQLMHPVYKKPELLATAPNQVWSWDITKLKGPVKWTHFQLYVILDIYSRYVVGWLVAPGEAACIASHLIEDTCLKQSIQPGSVTIHADRGSSMKSKTLALLYADLGVTKSHSRPYVSNDNPFSEAQFKTLKYRPGFPERFGSIEDARVFCRAFFHWYNKEHRHSGIGMLAPEMVHYGQAPEVIQRRNLILGDAYSKHPERFVHRAPRHPDLPSKVWINPPAKIAGSEGDLH